MKKRSKPKAKEKIAKKAAKKPKKRSYEDFHHEPKSEYELTDSLSEELKDAWAKLKNFATAMGDQRVYTSAKAIMFARKTCYMFVRPKKAYLETVFFLRDEQADPMIFRTDRVSKTKVSHTVRLIHEDLIETPLTEWLEEAYTQASE